MLLVWIIEEITWVLHIYLHYQNHYKNRDFIKKKAYDKVGTWQVDRWWWPTSGINGDWRKNSSRGDTGGDHCKTAFENHR